MTSPSPKRFEPPGWGGTLQRLIADRSRIGALNDPTAPAGDRLRAMEQLESRVHGKPKETVETVEGETETQRWLREMTPEQRLELLRRRGLRAVGEH